MNLMDDEFVPKKEEKSKKSSKILIVLMVLLVVGIVAIIMVLPLLKTEKLSIRVNGTEQAKLLDILEIQDDGKIYIPIKDIAEYLGYSAYNGNYENKSENTSECYVESTNEVASFVADSNEIEKINKSTSNKTYYTIDEAVQMKDGKLYTTMDGIEKGFNVAFNYNQDNKKITINTLKYLIDAYESPVLNMGYKEISKNFEDAKAIFNSLIIVKGSNNKYGLVNIDTDEEVLETKYDKIEYMPAFGDFLVESNGKKGIVTSTGRERIRIQYDSIVLINPKIKIYALKNDNLWALYDVEGNKLTNFEYNSFGCTISKVKNASSLLLIPDYNIIIGNKNNKYVLINENGQELLNGIEFDEAYSIVDNNQTNYYVVRNDKTYDVIEILEELKNRNSN